MSKVVRLKDSWANSTKKGVERGSKTGRRGAAGWCFGTGLGETQSKEEDLGCWAVPGEPPDSVRVCPRLEAQEARQAGTQVVLSLACRPTA